MHLSLPFPAGTYSSVPIELDRDRARELAREELADPAYASEPGLMDQLARWVRELLASIVEAATGTLPARVAVVVVIALVLIGVVVIVARNGPLARQHAIGTDPLFGAARRTAAEHRERADAAADAGDWNTAVVERFRAVAARLEENHVLPARPGWTAGETAREAAANRPDLRTELVDAAARFDSIRYGHHTARRADDEALQALDRALGAPPRRSAASGSAAAPVPPR